ncbi:hypothetical protein BSKO_03136 [Bryopsis sp. KO-2023]|nr:hypothetical protein BSKO_03136 [Bryopsis sp. KO-2023]
MKASIQICVFLAAFCFVGFLGTEGVRVQNVLVDTVQIPGGQFQTSSGVGDAATAAGIDVDGLLAGLIGDFQTQTQRDQRSGGPRRGGQQSNPSNAECPCNNDMAPPAAEGETKDGSTCLNRKERGECQADYMITNNYCACTCDRCNK